MKRQAAIVSAVPIVVGIGVTIASSVSAATSPAVADPPPIVVNAAVGDTFAPVAPGSAKATVLAEQNVLTESQAAARFQALDPDFIPPANARFQLGTLTAAVGNGTYRFFQVPAYAITFTRCPVYSQPDVAPANQSCVQWLFLDARTGDMLEQVAQQ